MTDINVAALRAAAEAALLRGAAVEALGSGDWFPDIRSAGDTVDLTDATFIAAVSPSVVLALLDELDSLRSMGDRVAALAVEYDEYLAFVVGVGARPGNQSEVHDAALAADQLWEALEGHRSAAKERWARVPTEDSQGPQIDTEERP